MFEILGNSFLVEEFYQSLPLAQRQVTCTENAGRICDVTVRTDSRKFILAEWGQLTYCAGALSRWTLTTCESLRSPRLIKKELCDLFASLPFILLLSLPFWSLTMWPAWKVCLPQGWEFETHLSLLCLFIILAVTTECAVTTNRYLVFYFKCF